MANGHIRSTTMSKVSPSSQNDIVLIQGLALEASIGVFDWEKKIKQQLVFDLELSCDFSKASVSDDIQDAVNYAQVCEEIEKILSFKHYQLLEYLAEKISGHLFETFQISSVKLTIFKPEAVAKTRQVGVSIFRERPEADSLLSPKTRES